MDRDHGPTPVDSRRGPVRDNVLGPITSREFPAVSRTVVAAPVAAEVVTPAVPKGRGTESRPIRIFPFGVSRNRLEQAIAQVRIPATIVRDLRDADIVMTLKNYYRQKPQPIREAETRGISVYVLRANTATQMEHVLAGLAPTSIRTQTVADDDQSTAPQPGGSVGNSGNDQVTLTSAMEETETAIGMIIDGGPPVSLTPQQSYIRKLQHQLADRYNLASRSRGREPNRFVEISRAGMQ